jgi:AcrR family transcriptional regulator
VSATRRQPARRGEGDRLREELLAATERILLREGDADRVSVRAIAAQVGCAPGAVYMHFADRQDLLFAVCERHFAELDRRAEVAVAAHDDPVEALAAMGKAYVDFGLAHPEAYRVLFMTPAAPVEFTDERVAPAAAFDRLVGAVQRCIDAGRFADHSDAWLVATGLWSSVHGVTSLLVAKPAFPWPPVDQLVDHVLQVASRGLTA